MSNLSIANYDARKYPLGPPYDGTRGAAYRSWCDVILTALSMYDLKDPDNGVSAGVGRPPDLGSDEEEWDDMVESLLAQCDRCPA